jgi:hypothetical protein
MTVSDAKLKRVQQFISVCEGGALADALMTLVLAYEHQLKKVETLKDRHARLLELQQKA